MAHFSTAMRSLPVLFAQQGGNNAYEMGQRVGQYTAYALMAAIVLAILMRVFKKRLKNADEVAAWLVGVGPHLFCCGHVHAAWAFTPPELPNQLCLNSGAPLLRDPTGLHPPGFLEIDLVDDNVSVVHHAWTGVEWSIFPLVQNLRFFSTAPA